MSVVYKPYHERTPDSQYKRNLRIILTRGEFIEETAQGVGAITYMAPPPMRFDLSNGVPLITERSIGFWKKPIAEILAFIKGKRTIPEIENEGCDYWKYWTTEEIARKIGIPPNDL
ncbi:MAG: thymidylate synthase, partial [Parcubacteria group bacterium]|nr:thymidylate synthase [Parcubacteria group bacterium]